MNSKEILETFGISKNFGILLFIQSIIVIIGCFFAFQDVFNNFTSGNFPLIICDIVSLLLFLTLIYYSFIGFKKEEKHFKIAVYLFMITILIYILISFSLSSYTTLISNIIVLILLIYFVYNLNNFKNAKIAILLVVLVKLITSLFVNIVGGFDIGLFIPRLIYLIPSVSIALTYIARYNKKGFKQLNK